VTLVVGREQTVLEAGHSYTVPPGVPHTWYNSGDRPVRLVVDFQPAGQMQSFFETFCGLAAEHACDQRGQPRLVQVAASISLWQMHLATPPIAMRRLAMGTLRPLAWALDYRARYRRFEGRPQAPWRFNRRYRPAVGQDRAGSQGLLMKLFQHRDLTQLRLLSHRDAQVRTRGRQTHPAAGVALSSCQL
jgi:hypothetical protein